MTAMEWIRKERAKQIVFEQRMKYDFVDKIYKEIDEATENENPQLDEKSGSRNCLDDYTALVHVLGVNLNGCFHCDLSSLSDRILHRGNIDGLVFAVQIRRRS